MRGPIIAAVVWMAVGMSGASAQDGQEAGRRFTQPPIDPNRNNKVEYRPVFWGFLESSRPRMPYNLQTACWNQVRIGATSRLPDARRGKIRYIMDSFNAEIGEDGIPQLRVIIAQNPAATFAAPPLLRVVNNRLGISVTAAPLGNEAADPSRYLYLIDAPQWRLLGEGNWLAQVEADSYDILLLPPEKVRALPFSARAATFGGVTVAEQMAQPPPQLPHTERVAGKRIEYRSAQSAGYVVQENVAGRRQELKNR